MGIPGTGSTGRQIANNSRIRTTLRHTDLDQISSTEHDLGPHTENRAVPTRPFFSPTLTEHLLTPPAADYSHCLTHSYKSTCNPQQSMKSQHNRRTVGPEIIEQDNRQLEVAPWPNCSPIAWESQNTPLSNHNGSLSTDSVTIPLIIECYRGLY